MPFSGIGGASKQDIRRPPVRQFSDIELVFQIGALRHAKLADVTHTSGTAQQAIQPCMIAPYRTTFLCLSMQPLHFVPPTP